MDDADAKALLEGWFRAHADRVLAYLLHRTDRETAQDVLQEVFVTAFRKAAQLPDPPTGWLFGTARRLLANAERGNRRRDLLALRVADTTPRNPRSPFDDNGVGDVVAGALAQLSNSDQEVLTLSAWYELSAEQAAQALGCSRATYTVRLHRARHRLADRLRAAGYRDPDADPLPEVTS